MTEQGYADYQNHFREFMSSLGLDNLATGHLRCPDCEVKFEDDTCPKCKKDIGSFPVEPYISSQPCSICDDGLQGERYDCHGWSKGEKRIVEVTCVCSDCVYYAEHGRLPEHLMKQIGNNR